MTDPDLDLEKKLDEVIGKEYDAAETMSTGKRVANRLVQWIVGAIFAMTAVSTIVFVIESHRLPKDVPRPATKPVEVQIVPDLARRQ